MNTAEDIKRMLGELVDEAIRIGRAEGEKTLGTDAQLKEQVKRLVDEKQMLAQNLDRVNEENNDLELTIGNLKADLEKAKDEKTVIQAKVDSFDGVSREQAAEVVRLKEQVKKLNEALAIYRVPTPRACPFCGGRPDVVAINKERWVVACHSDTCDVNPETDFYGTIEEAVSAWNHRVESAST